MPPQLYYSTRSNLDINKSFRATQAHVKHALDYLQVIQLSHHLTEEPFLSL